MNRLKSTSLALIAGALSAGCGVIALIGASASAISTWHFLANAESVPGEIIKLEPDEWSSGSRQAYHPIFSYKDTKGAQHEFRDPSSYAPPPFAVGDAVTVLYLEGNPAEAKLSGFVSLWLSTTVFGVIGCGFTLLGSLLIFGARRSANTCPGAVASSTANTDDLPLVLRNLDAINDARNAGAIGLIPHRSMNISWTTNISVVLRRKGPLWVQGVSTSILFFGVSFLVAALIVVLLPWHPIGHLKLITVCVVAWTGLCAVGVYFAFTAYTQSVEVDPKEKTIRIEHDGVSRTFRWPQILGLQECYQRDPGGRCSGFQLNLVVIDSDGKVDRICLHKDRIQSAIKHLAAQYATALPFA